MQHSPSTSARRLRPRVHATFLQLQYANRPFWPLVSKYTIFESLPSAECNFPESWYSRMSFSWIFVQPNAIFPKYHLPERHFSEHHFPKYHFPERHFPERHFPAIVWSRTSFYRTLCDLTNTYRMIQETIRVTYQQGNNHNHVLIQ